MVILCQFYVKIPLRNLYFLNMGLTPPPPLLNNIKKTAGLIKRYIPKQDGWPPVFNENCLYVDVFFSSSFYFVLHLSISCSYLFFASLRL